MTDERAWARTSSTYKPAPTGTKLAPMDAAKVLGAIGLYLTLAVPFAVILWRLAVSPW